LSSAGSPDDPGTAIFLIALSIGGIGYVLGPHVSRAVFHNVRRRTAEASPIDLVAVALGLIIGGVASALLAVPLAQLPDPAGSLLPFITALILCSLAIGITVSRKRDLIAPWFRSASDALPADMPHQETASLVPTLLDTNILIDGRIVDLLQTGFISGPLHIPRFVLTELQLIADASDPLRRQRGRRGLDTLSQLRERFPHLVQIVDPPVDSGPDTPVDTRLVDAARQLAARILTNDFNLNRIAEAQDVAVLNLNELSRVMRPPLLPGDDLSLKVVQEGREAGQGIGFLDDGTMVVVDGGHSLIGQSVQVTVTRLLQTGAGRMIFATPSRAA
ncbi:MAG TPA: TRAM domain-containing protein, partial [Thermomicrobiales bacterium]|nr:TRAM domain-containing protein [Thermomicrobiales bacterium]